MLEWWEVRVTTPYTIFYVRLLHTWINSFKMLYLSVPKVI